VHLAILTGIASEIEWLAGEYAAALALNAESMELFEQAGERGWLSTMAAAQGLYHYELGNLGLAAAEAERALELGATDDAVTQILARQALAKVAAGRGEFGHAEALAREAVAIAERTDELSMIGDAYADLALVLRLVGKQDETKAAIDAAIERYERKGNVIGARKARAFAGYDEEALAGR
jgi:tetratricopeptide (TPR) repeat protein